MAYRAGRFKMDSLNTLLRANQMSHQRAMDQSNQQLQMAQMDQQLKAQKFGQRMQLLDRQLQLMKVSHDMTIADRQTTVQENVASSQIGNLNARTAGQLTENRLREEIMPLLVREKEADVGAKEHGVRLAGIQADVAEETKDDVVRLKGAEADLREAQAGLTEAQARKADSEIDLINARIEGLLLDNNFKRDTERYRVLQEGYKAYGMGLQNELTEEELGQIRDDRVKQHYEDAVGRQKEAVTTMHQVGELAKQAENDQMILVNQTAKSAFWGELEVDDEGNTIGVKQVGSMWANMGELLGIGEASVPQVLSENILAAADEIMRRSREAGDPKDATTAVIEAFGEITQDAAVNLVKKKLPHWGGTRLKNGKRVKRKVYTAFQKLSSESPEERLQAREEILKYVGWDKDGNLEVVDLGFPGDEPTDKPTIASQFRERAQAVLPSTLYVAAQKYHTNSITEDNYDGMLPNLQRNVDRAARRVGYIADNIDTPENLTPEKIAEALAGGSQ